MLSSSVPLVFPDLSSSLSKYPRLPRRAPRLEYHTTSHTASHILKWPIASTPRYITVSKTSTPLTVPGLSPIHSAVFSSRSPIISSQITCCSSVFASSYLYHVYSFFALQYFLGKKSHTSRETTNKGFVTRKLHHLRGRAYNMIWLTAASTRAVGLKSHSAKSGEL